MDQALANTSAASSTTFGCGAPPRSASDISANFRQQLVGPQAGLVANWRFDESSGGVAADSSGKNHPATIAGGATFASDIHP
ncbi:MAG TPA: hypothetical protein VGL99_08830 [Chloroflexota bacterium]